MLLTTPAPDKAHAVIEKSVEISIKGRWITVPALDVNGTTIIIKGTLVKLAIIEAEEWLEHELTEPDLCVNALKDRSHGLRADVFTFAQRLPEALPQYQYHLEQDSVAAIHVTTFRDWWEMLPQETRKNVKRAQKRGVAMVVKELDDSLIKDLVELNNDSPVRQQRPYAHYGKTFEQVKKDQSTYLDRSDFICAYCERELVGFLKIVYKGDVASILQFVPKISQQDKRPANALIAKAVELCEARGISYLTYGLFNYGNKHDDTLLQFKRRNGFREILTPRYYVPLTAWGSMSIKLNLHRGVLGVLPHGVITLATRMRAGWYNRK